MSMSEEKNVVLEDDHETYSEEMTLLDYWLEENAEEAAIRADYFEKFIADQDFRDRGQQ